MNNKYSVYKHTNNINGKVYIGITKQVPERRWQNGHGYAGTFFWNAIVKYGWDNFKHEVLLTGLSKEDACRIEKELISAYNSRDREYGYNICEGGQTGDNLAGYTKSGKENRNAVMVRRIYPNTGEEKVFDTIAQAAKEMGINHRGISKNCHGLSKTYYGYKWEYVEKEVEKPFRHEIGKYPHVHQWKKVMAIDQDGTKMIFDSISSAAKNVGDRANNIGRYANGIRNDPKGRRWSFVFDSKTERVSNEL